MLKVTPAFQLYPGQLPVTDWPAVAAYELYARPPLTLSSGRVLRLALSAASLYWSMVACATARFGPLSRASLYERSNETSGSPMIGKSTMPTADRSEEHTSELQSLR